MIFYFLFDDSRLNSALTDTYQKIYVKDLEDQQGYAPANNAVAALGSFDVEEETLKELLNVEVFNVSTDDMQAIEINNSETLYLPIRGSGIKKIMDILVAGSSSYKKQPYIGIKVADVKMHSAKKYVDAFAKGPIELTVRIVKNDDGLTIKLDSTNTGKRVIFSDVGTAEKWINKLPERYANTIVIPYYFEDVRKWGVGLVNTNKKEQKQAKAVFDTHVVKTGYRPRFVYLTRTDSLNFAEDPDLVVTKAPESSLESDVDINDEDDQENAADPELEVGGKDEEDAFDLEDFM